MTDILSVSNAEELMNALALAKGGETIELAGGNYGNLLLIDGKTGFDVKFDSEVTIRSADADAPASFTGMGLQGVSNLTFDSVIFDYEFSPGDATWISPFTITSGSNNIIIRKAIFDGDLASGVSDVDDGYGYGRGLIVTESSNVSVLDSEFFNWQRGALFKNSDYITFSENQLFSLRSDGINFSAVNSVTVENNYLHDFRASPDSSDHQDMIQFWTNGTTTPSTDIVIKGNVLDIGEGSRTQSIFMRNDMVDRSLAGPEMFYQNILIENNTIYNAHTHGITVGETDGLIIRNNTVLFAEGGTYDAIGSVTIPKINVKVESTSVVIQNNVTSAINGFTQQSDWIVSSNAIIQPSEYLDHFVISTIDIVNGAHNFIALPYGSIENLGAGSNNLQFRYAPEQLTAQFQVYSDESSDTSLIFDASLTVGPLGPISERDATFLWIFEDGSKATGRLVKHDFASPGYHEVTLTVVDTDGTMAQAQFTAGIAGDDIVRFDSQSGVFKAYAYGEQTGLDGSGSVLLTTADGYALKLGGQGTQTSVSSSELTRFFGTNGFEMSMSIKAGSATSWGEVARVHGSLVTSIDQNGNFQLELFLNDGSRVQIASEGIALNDGALHDVVVRFDGVAGFAEILIDDHVVASETVSGSLSDNPRSLVFGNPWGDQNFNGELSAFSLSAENRDFSLHDSVAMPVSSAETDITEESTFITSPDNSETVDSTASPETYPAQTELEEEFAPEEETTLPEPEEETTLPEPEEETTLPEPLLSGGYQLALDSVTTSESVLLHDDAHVIETQDSQALSFDGKKDYVSLGRLTEFEGSQELAFSVDFVSNNIDGGTERLVWNHAKLGLTLEGGGLRIHAQNNDNKFHQGFQIDGLSLNDGNLHNATVMVDAYTDRLQVVVDGVLVLDEQGTDFDFSGGSEREWSLGTAWNRWFEGEVHDFQVSDDFQFVESMAEGDTILG